MDVSLENNSNPLVSVIIPNYNHAKYLDERIQSVLNQTYQNFEVIILDDKSTDNSIEIINKYRDNPHVTQIVFNEENTGKPCLQWKKGFELAKGELIWIAESDDCCSLNFLEKMVNIHASNDVVVAFCLSQQIDDEGRLMSTINRGIKEGVLDGLDFIDKYLGKTCVIVNASSAIIEKKCISEIPDDYLNLEAAADWLFWIEVCRQGSVSFLCEALNFFRFHGENTTKKQALTGKNYKADKKILDYLLAQHLITSRSYKESIRFFYNKISLGEYESEQIRENLMNIYGFNTLLFRIKLLLSKIINKLDCMLWGV